MNDEFQHSEGKSNSKNYLKKIRNDNLSDNELKNIISKAEENKDNSGDWKEVLKEAKEALQINIYKRNNKEKQKQKEDQELVKKIMDDEDGKYALHYKRLAQIYINFDQFKNLFLGIGKTREDVENILKNAQRLPSSNPTPLQQPKQPWEDWDNGKLQLSKDGDIVFVKDHVYIRVGNRYEPFNTSTATLYTQDGCLSGSWSLAAKDGQEYKYVSHTEAVKRQMNRQVFYTGQELEDVKQKLKTRYRDAIRMRFVNEFLSNKDRLFKDRCVKLFESNPNNEKYKYYDLVDYEKIDPLYNRNLVAEKSNMLRAKEAIVRVEFNCCNDVKQYDQKRVDEENERKEEEQKRQGVEQKENIQNRRKQYQKYKDLENAKEVGNEDSSDDSDESDVESEPDEEDRIQQDIQDAIKYLKENPQYDPNSSKDDINKKLREMEKRKKDAIPLAIPKSKFNVYLQKKTEMKNIMQEIKSIKSKIKKKRKSLEKKNDELYTKQYSRGQGKDFNEERVNEIKKLKNQEDAILKKLRNMTGTQNPKLTPEQRQKKIKAYVDSLEENSTQKKEYFKLLISKGELETQIKELEKERDDEFDKILDQNMINISEKIEPLKDEINKEKIKLFNLKNDIEKLNNGIDEEEALQEALDEKNEKNEKEIEFKPTEAMFASDSESEAPKEIDLQESEEESKTVEEESKGVEAPKEIELQESEEETKTVEAPKEVVRVDSPMSDDDLMRLMKDDRVLDMLDGLSDSESVREMSMSESDQEVREVKVSVDSDSDKEFSFAASTSEDDTLTSMMQNMDAFASDEEDEEEVKWASTSSGAD